MKHVQYNDTIIIISKYFFFSYIFFPLLLIPCICTSRQGNSRNLSPGQKLLYRCILTWLHLFSRAVNSSHSTRMGGGKLSKKREKKFSSRFSGNETRKKNLVVATSQLEISIFWQKIFYSFRLQNTSFLSGELIRKDSHCCSRWLLHL